MESKLTCFGGGFMTMMWQGQTHEQLERQAASMPNDPFDKLVASIKAASDQNVAFYTDHLAQLTSAYRANMAKHDRDGLLNNMVKALMESDNSREDLCYQVVVAVDKLARA